MNHSTQTLRLWNRGSTPIRVVIEPIGESIDVAPGLTIEIACHRPADEDHVTPEFVVNDGSGEIMLGTVVEAVYVLEGTTRGRQIGRLNGDSAEVVRCN